ncbi:MAG: carbohydrate binding domain-containing protein [Lachnospiraceae bacterium]|nr:carbohydrate binding domain-containing protein [Lachnospiraceae bacterium]
MKRKNVKWISYLLICAMSFSSMASYSSITAYAEEGIATEETLVVEETETSTVVEESKTGEETETGTEIETEVVTETGTETETEVVTETGTEAETEVVTETETETETEVVTEIETETEPEVVTEVETEAVEEETEITTENETEAATEVETETEEVFEVQGEIVEVVSDALDFEPEKDGEYTLKFKEEFTGNTLNSKYWQPELHEPGWVNNELQEYTNSEENIFIIEDAEEEGDGILVLQANKETRDGKDYYTSGKVTTQNKYDFKYGKIEARIKVPEAKGLLPAFWLMPRNEQFYGQWPRCGEIDVMEVLGHQTDTVYGTIHYGNPHKEKQGSYTLTDGSTFASGYHTFTVEWEPGKFTYYMDGIKYHEVTNWFTKTEGGDEITFPAPFDQEFYLQLNLAVGGNWPGNPDGTFSADGEQLCVDWVKVWQKDSYDENVEKPEEIVNWREPDANGNYIVNGDFATAEALDDEEYWSFLTALGGEAVASIAGNILTIDTTNAGTVDYSVQLVQPQLPMRKGNTYKLSFDAKAAAERTMIVDVSGPDNGYIRYFNDTKLTLGTEWATYEYTFTMTGEDDANGRLEFNLGNQGSAAQVQLKNVKLEVTGKEELEEDSGMLPDGNYVHNGTFDIGTNRLGYWDVVNTAENATVSVTNDNGVRQLKVDATAVTALEQVVVKQKELALVAGTEYELTFDAYADAAKSVKVIVAGQTMDVDLTETNQKFTYKFKTPEEPGNTDLELHLGTTGTTYVDNVTIKEDSPLVNGEFNNKMAGWEHFADSGISSAVTAEVVKEDDNNVIRYTIGNTGDADWKIQLKQNNITLEKGKSYKLAFKAKSDMNRKIMFALQRDGASDNDWTSYSGTDIIDLTNEYAEYSKTFTMSNATDTATILSISMGAVGGTQITEEHHVWMDSFTLVEVEPEELPKEEMGATGVIRNGNFVEGDKNWQVTINAPAKATVDFSNNSATFDIDEVGSENWHIQLKQSGIHLEYGQEYVITMKMQAENTRDVEFCCMSTGYAWYGGGMAKLIGGKETVISHTFRMGDANATESDANADFTLSLGKIAGGESAAGKVTVKYISIMPKEDVVSEGLRVLPMEDRTYTGKAIIPVVVVYDGAVPLQEKTDYVVSFKDNKKAGTAKVTVTGKGNYAGTAATEFKIIAKDVAAEDVVISYKDKLLDTGKNQKPLSKISYNGITLNTKNDYKVEYFKCVNGEVPEDAKALSQIKAAGDYRMVITGKGNFTGTVTKDVKVYAKNSVVDISKTAITVGGKKSGYSVVCDGTEKKPEIKVTYKGKVVDSANYTVNYENNVNVGTAKVTITGVMTETEDGVTGYIGSVTKTFKIKATKLSDVAAIDTTKWKNKVDFNETLGAAVQESEMLKLKAGKTDDTFAEGTAYKVSYSKNTKAGKATVIYTGIGKYSGTIKKNFTVNAVELFKDNQAKTGVEVSIGKTAVYAQKGSKVDVVVSLNGTTLVEGKDYKVTYKNNKAATTEKTKENKKPQVTITGINGYKGKITAKFTITPADLSTMDIKAADVAYQNKKGKYKSAPVLTDADGKKLKVNRDYTVKYYLAADGTELGKNDVVDAGEAVKVVVTAKGKNYTGSNEAVYKVAVQDISKAKVVVKTKPYTGKAITLTAEDFTTIKVGDTKLKEGVHYEIVEDSYENNINKGTASVTIKGIGNYAGTKKVTFKITSRAMAWFQNIFK